MVWVLRRSPLGKMVPPRPAIALRAQINSNNTQAVSNSDPLLATFGRFDVIWCAFGAFFGPVCRVGLVCLFKDV